MLEPIMLKTILHSISKNHVMLGGCWIFDCIQHLASSPPEFCIYFVLTSYLLQWKMSKKNEKHSIGAAPFSKGKGLALLAKLRTAGIQPLLWVNWTF
jgi:hypothetical protein